MTWDQIHAYAEEAELWTTLAINFWAIATGIIFAVLRVFGWRKPVGDALVVAAAYAVQITLVVGLGSLGTMLFMPEVAQPAWLMWARWVAAIVGIPIGAIVLYLVYWRRKARTVPTSMRR